MEIEEEEGYKRSVFVKKLVLSATSQDLKAAVEVMGRRGERDVSMCTLLSSYYTYRLSISLSMHSITQAKLGEGSLEEARILTNKAGKPRGMAVMRLKSLDLSQQALGESVSSQ